MQQVMDFVYCYGHNRHTVKIIYKQIQNRTEHHPLLQAAKMFSVNGIIPFTLLTTAACRTVAEWYIQM
jgi:hypothetical protein